VVAINLGSRQCRMVIPPKTTRLSMASDERIVIGNDFAVLPPDSIAIIAA
jgi:hypothetical protein